MLQPKSFFRAGMLLMVLSACAFAFAPPQDSAAQKSKGREPVLKDPNEIEAAVTTRVEPVYPAVAKWAGQSGTVGVRLLINEQGEVINAGPATGPPLLKNAAVTAARGWKFKPSEVEGKAVKMQGLLLIKFPPDGNRPPFPPAADDLARAKEAVQTFPDVAEAHYWLGEAYAERRQSQEAEKAFKLAIELKPDYEEAYLELAKLYGESKTSADLLRVYQQAVESIPHDSLTLLTRQATALGEAKRHAEAAEVWRHALQINADDVISLHMLAWNYIQLRRYDEAVAAIEEELKVSPSYSSAYFNLGLAYYRMGRYEEAVATYQKLIRPYPDGTAVHVYYYLGLSLLQAGRAAEAIDAFNRALELQGRFPDVLREMRPQMTCALGGAYVKTKRFDEAVEAMKKGIQERPNDGCAYTQLGSAYAGLGKVAEAEAAYKKAIEFSPDRNDAYLYLGYSLMGQHRLAEAETVLRQGVKRVPDCVQLHAYLGFVLEQLDRGAEAEVELKETLRLEPNNSTALNNLGYRMVERGEKLEEALAMIQRAVNIEPNNSAYLDSLALAYFKLGRLDEAERAINRALRGSLEAPDMYEHLGDIYEKQGRHGEALGAWQKALALTKNGSDASRLKAKLGGK